MSHICTILPPHILHHVAQSQDNGATTQSIFADTLRMTRTIREQRALLSGGPPQQPSNRTSRSPTPDPPAARQQRSFGIVPPVVIFPSSSESEGEEDNMAVSRGLAARAIYDTLVGDAASSKGLVRTIYDMEHDSNYLNLPGDVVLIREGGKRVSKRNDKSGDPNECYEGFKDTYDFFRKVFERKSIDNKGMKLLGSVHFGVNYQNAFWDGRQMVFGDGDGRILRDFTSRPDV